MLIFTSNREVIAMKNIEICYFWRYSSRKVRMIDFAIVICIKSVNIYFITRNQSKCPDAQDIPTKESSYNRYIEK